MTNFTKNVNEATALDNGTVTLIATVLTILGAARALPGRTAKFNLAPYLLEATAEDIQKARRAGWNQDADGDFLMDCLHAEASSITENAVSQFLTDMSHLSFAQVNEVCWRVSVDPAEAETFIRLYHPSPSIPEPLLVAAE